VVIVAFFVIDVFVTSNVSRLDTIHWYPTYGGFFVAIVMNQEFLFTRLCMKLANCGHVKLPLAVHEDT
jgi:hypothetical protein